MPKIEVTEAELKAIEQRRKREKKKEEERQKLEALKNTNFQVTTFEDVCRKSHPDVSEAEVKRFVERAKLLIAEVNKIYTLDAVKFHDEIYSRFIKKGWKCIDAPVTAVGTYEITFRYGSEETVVYATQWYHYQYNYFYKIDEDRMLVYDHDSRRPAIVVKAATKTSKLQLKKGPTWYATVQNSKIDYHLGALNSDQMARILGCPTQDIKGFDHVLAPHILRSLHFDTIEKYPLTNKQICASLKEQILSSAEKSLKDRINALEHDKKLVKLVKNSSFEEFAKL